MLGLHRENNPFEFFKLSSLNAYLLYIVLAHSPTMVGTEEAIINY